MSSTKNLQASWYDFPHYYDIAFRSESPREADFIEAACRKYCPFPVRTLFEPACGTGRLVVEMAARGYRTTGLDLSRPALDYCRQRLAQKKLKARLIEGDMTDFRLGKPIDAAFCTFNSFRHLLEEEQAKRHLECVVETLRPGGIYILGFHLLPPDADLACIERWTEKLGRTQVTTTLRVLSSDRRRRLENLRVSVLARSGGKETRLRTEFPLRLYTAAQFRSLLKKVPAFELCDVYDFWYEIDEPLKFDNELGDAVFVLKKRG